MGPVTGMSDDVYRTSLAPAMAKVRARAESFSDVAEIGYWEAPEFVRVCVLPQAHGACPFDLMVRANQKYDVQIGEEFYEDCPVTHLSLFDDLLAALAEGRLVQRRHVSVATGCAWAIEDTGDTR